MTRLSRIIYDGVTARPNFGTVLAGLIVFIGSRRGWPKLPRAGRILILIILALNWGNLPFVWHLKLFRFVPLLRLRILLCRLGFNAAPPDSRAKELGLKGRDQVFVAVRRSPWDVRIRTRESVGFG